MYWNPLDKEIQMIYFYVQSKRTSLKLFTIGLVFSVAAEQNVMRVADNTVDSVGDKEARASATAAPGGRLITSLPVQIVAQQQWLPLNC